MAVPKEVLSKIHKEKRVTQSIKENVVLTFELLGGVTEYAAWARENKDKFYDHWIKMLPSEIKAEVSMSSDFANILEKARTRVQERRLEEINADMQQQMFGPATDVIEDAVYSRSE